MGIQLKISAVQNCKLYSVIFYITLHNSVRFPHQPKGGQQLFFSLVYFQLMKMYSVCELIGKVCEEGQIGQMRLLNLVSQFSQTMSKMSHQKKNVTSSCNSFIFEKKIPTSSHLIAFYPFSFSCNIIFKLSRSLRLIQLVIVFYFWRIILFAIKLPVTFFFFFLYWLCILEVYRSLKNPCLQ